MNAFQNILKTIQERLKVSEHDSEKIVSLLIEKLGVPLQKNQIMVKGNILFLEVSPLLRTEVQLKKKLLLSFLKEHFLTFSDIQIKTK
ncbi:MAG TPA: hypothetical protein VLB02_02185 [Candidatus Paceibacterota bacterium]|nr:hypothetical protein [Candidatus Paceibacterota bacterium]